jgi:outer membrane protein
MTRWLLWGCLAMGVGASASAEAQVGLNVEEAVARAMIGNTNVRAAAVTEREASAKLIQARSAFWPALDVIETWQRGNQPVFVFSSLLAQRQFATSNFAVGALNHPAPIDHYRTALTLDMPIFNAATRPAVRGAALAVEVAATQREAVGRDLAPSVVASYAAVVGAMAMRRVVAAGLESARADLDLAERRRDLGLATDADVLQVALHVAATREREIRTRADEAVARARLNELMGADLDDVFVLDETVTADDMTASLAADPEPGALETRTEVRLAALNESLADAAVASARAQFMPQVTAMAGWEANGAAWESRASGWMAGVTARVNLFRGFADRARVTEAQEIRTRRRIERERTETAVRVDIRVARARLEAARATVEVAEASVLHAAESHRIIRDRYEAGLVDVTVLLRAAESVQTADARQIAARVDMLVAAAEWRRATGK